MEVDPNSGSKLEDNWKSKLFWFIQGILSGIIEVYNGKKLMILYTMRLERFAPFIEKLEFNN